MRTQTLVIDNYDKLNDSSIISIIKTINDINGVEEFSVDSEIKMVIISISDNSITKEMIIEKLDKAFE